LPFLDLLNGLLYYFVIFSGKWKKYTVKCMIKGRDKGRVNTICENYVRPAGKDQWQLTTIKRVNHIIGHSVTIVLEYLRKGCLVGLRQDIGKNLNVIAVDILVNFHNSLMSIMLMAIYVTADMII